MKTINYSTTFEALQAQLLEENETYVLMHEQETYGTEVQPLEIPENSTLKFINGCFKGGYVTLKNIIQNDCLYQVWNDVNFNFERFNSIDMGFRNPYIRPEWFGAAGNNIDDDYSALQKAIDVASRTGIKVLLSGKCYICHSTLKIYSNTVLEGEIPGSVDRRRQIGASIEFEQSALMGAPALLIKSETEENEVDPSGDYKFKISNVGFASIGDKGSWNSIGIRIESKKNSTKIIAPPRQGIIENIIIRGFDCGISIDSLSYVMFRNISIENFVNGIKINGESNSIIEFGWFKNIYLNSGQNEENTVSGIEINTGNNIYFDEIDVNDCKNGISLQADNNNRSLFNVYFNRVNFARCGNCIDIYASNNHITRLKFSEVTLDYKNSGIHFSNYTDINNDINYCIADCVFDTIFDCLTYDYECYMLNSELSLSDCMFTNLRALNKIKGMQNVNKLTMTNFVPYGRFVMPANVVEVEYSIPPDESVVVFDFVPIVNLQAESDVNYSYRVENVQQKIKIIVTLDVASSQSIWFNYMIPQFM